MLYVIVTGLVTAGVLTGYYLWHRSYVQPFSCQANLVQYHPDETLTVWLNYTFDGKYHRQENFLSGGEKRSPLFADVRKKYDVPGR